MVKMMFLHVTKIWKSVYTLRKKTTSYRHQLHNYTDLKITSNSQQFFGHSGYRRAPCL